MKTLEQIQADLNFFSTKLGFDINKVEQGSPQWQTMKLGVISASNSKYVVAGKTTEGRSGYLAELVGQIATKEFPEVNARQMEWGKTHEAAARSAYEFATGYTVQTVPFVYKDALMRVGISPDGLTAEIPRGLELKCPFTSKVHIDFLANGKIKPDYEKQVQFSMWVTDAETWDFGSYDPRMRAKKEHHVTIERDPKFMTTLDDAVPQFIYEMDKMLSIVGFEFGDQWK